MLVVFASQTGNIRRFMDKLNMRSIEIEEGLKINEPFIIITYTTGFGSIPDKVLEFLNNNFQYLKGVSASGNINWGSNYGKSADKISEMYGVPIISKFELSGSKKDIDIFKERVQNIE
jgi:protein involved in ribonucleotide reduction